MPNTNGQAGTNGNGTAWLDKYGVGPDAFLAFYSNPDNTRAAIADLDEIARNSTVSVNQKCAGDIRDAYQHFLTHLETNPEANHDAAFLEVEEAIVRHWSEGVGFTQEITDTEKKVSFAMRQMTVTMVADVNTEREKRKAAPTDDIWNMPENDKDFFDIFNDRDKIDEMAGYLENMDISLLSPRDKDVEEKKLLTAIKVFSLVHGGEEYLGENLNRLRDRISNFNAYASRQGASERDKKIRDQMKNLYTRLSKVDDFERYLAKSNPFYTSLWLRDGNPSDYIKNLTDPDKLKIMAESIRAYSDKHKLPGSLAGAFEELLEYVKDHPEPGRDMPLKKVWDALPGTIQAVEGLQLPDGELKIRQYLLNSLYALQKKASAIDLSMANRVDQREQNERKAAPMPNTNGQAGTGGNVTPWRGTGGQGADFYLAFYSNPDITRAAIADLDEIARNSTVPDNQKCAGDIRDAYQHFLTHLETNPEADHKDAFLEVEKAIVNYWSNGRVGFSPVITDLELRVRQAMLNMEAVMAPVVEWESINGRVNASPADDVWKMPESLDEVINILRGKDNDKVKEEDKGKNKEKLQQMIGSLEDLGVESMSYLKNKDVEASKVLNSIKGFAWAKEETVGEKLNDLRDRISDFNAFASREGASDRDKKIQGMLKGLSTQLSQVKDFSQYLAKGSPFYSSLWSRSSKPADHVKNLTDPDKLKLMAEGIRAFSDKHKLPGNLAGAFEELLEYVKAHPEPGRDMPLKKVWDAMPETIRAVEGLHLSGDEDRIAKDLKASLSALQKQADGIDLAMAGRANKREQEEREASARTEAEGAAIIQNSEWGKGKKSGQAAIDRLKNPSRVKDMVESMEKLSQLSIRNGGTGIPTAIVDSLKQLGQGLEKDPDGNHAEAVRSVFNALKPFSNGIPDKACNALVGQQLLGLRGSLDEFLRQPDALEKQFGGKAAKTENKAASVREKVSLYDLQNAERIAGERKERNRFLEDAKKKLKHVEVKKEEAKKNSGEDMLKDIRGKLKKTPGHRA